jgi:hypothetical protein
LRVKISYSVALDEIPDKARQLLYDVEKSLLSSSECIPEFEERDLYGDRYGAFKDKIDKTRRKLFVADSKLQDIVTILDDWKRASLALEVEKFESPAMAAEGVENVEISDQG